MDTFEEIRKVISTNLNVPLATISAHSKASDFAEWDSIHHLVLVMEVEQTFGFNFSLTEIAEFDSVERIVKAVEKRTKA